MKPCYLEFCGINSFSERAEINFETLLEYGLFGIFGDTGSGKSTVLDCIGFALYGEVFRSRSGSIADIINYRADKAFVNFEFEIVFEGARRKFRVEREVKRKNAQQSVKVSECKGDKQLVLSDGVRESNALLLRIVGLEQKDFEKCIALPQGEFAQFVKASRSDRLKLVSRLFNLEAYGERLVKRTNAKYAECNAELSTFRTRLEPFAEVNEAGEAALKESVTVLTRQEETQKAALASLRKEEKRVSDLFAKKTEAERAKKRLEELEAQKSEIEETEREMGRLEYAERALHAQKELSAASVEEKKAQAELTDCEKRKQAAQQRLTALSAFDEEKAEEELSRLIVLKTKAEQQAFSEEKKAKTKQLLEKARREYAEEAARFQGFSYEKERAETEKKLRELGEGDLLSFAEQEGKAALLRSEYKTFAAELSALEERYPAAKEGIEPLFEKYKALSEGEKKEFADIKSAYEAREKQRKGYQQTLIDLEARYGLYRTHLDRLQQLQTEGTRLKEELSELEKSGTDAGMPLQEIEKSIARLRREKKARSEEREGAMQALSRADSSLAAAKERTISFQKLKARADSDLLSALQKGKFSAADEAEGLIAKYKNAEAAQKRVTAFREEYAAAVTKCAMYHGDYGEIDGALVERVKAQLKCAEEEYAESLRQLALAKSDLKRMSENLEKKKALEKEEGKAKKRTELFERLKKMFEANKFMDFVAEEYLVGVAQDASGRLLSLTGGRYSLRYEGGAAGFTVGDNFNGGATRGVYTLSGGETFLVSLSLALALSAQICNKSLRPMEFFFLDEGFGTLDERLVDVVMDSLERLKGTSFSIGIISHVEELKHRIGRKLSVEKATEKHGSRIYVE